MGTTDASRRRFRPLGAIWRLLKATVSIAVRYRVTSLAAEVGFYALLALPPLILALAASAAWLSTQLTSQLAMEAAVRDFLSPFLTEDVVRKTIVPTLRDALNTPRYDIMSIGFVLSLWSGSRALHIYVDTISIMYGLAGSRGLVKSRLLSFGLYLGSLLLGSFAFPLVMMGPGLLSQMIPPEFAWLSRAYWIAVGVAGVLMLALLFHLSVPVRTSWWRNLPGALLGMLIWVGASEGMRLGLVVSLSPAPTQTRAMSIYGPLTTPIVLLIWLYVLALGVLLGAALNAAIDRVFPDGERSARRAAMAAELEHESFGNTLTLVRDRKVEEEVSERLGAADLIDQENGADAGDPAATGTDDAAAADPADAPEAAAADTRHTSRH